MDGFRGSVAAAKNPHSRQDVKRYIVEDLKEATTVIPDAPVLADGVAEAVADFLLERLVTGGAIKPFQEEA